MMLLLLLMMMMIMNYDENDQVVLLFFVVVVVVVVVVGQVAGGYVELLKTLIVGPERAVLVGAAWCKENWGLEKPSLKRTKST